MNNDMMNDQNPEEEEQAEAQREAEEQEQNQQEQDSGAPSGLSGLRAKAKTKVRHTFINGTKIVFKVIAALPMPVKIALALIILIFIIIIIIIGEETTIRTASAATNEIENFFSSDDSEFSEAEKEDFEKNASLLRFSLTTIHKIYENFKANEDDYTDNTKEFFEYVMGTREIQDSEFSNTIDASKTNGNGTWDQGGLDNVKFEVPGDERDYKVKFYTDLPTEENENTRLGTNNKALTFGIVASNSLATGTKILLENHGVFEVYDSGLEGLDDENTIAIFIPRKADEADAKYKERVEGYPEETIKGKVITIPNYSEYLYTNDTENTQNTEQNSTQTDENTSEDQQTNSNIEDLLENPTSPHW